jgi:hypothetical protein
MGFPTRVEPEHLVGQTKDARPLVRGLAPLLGAQPGKGAKDGNCDLVRRTWFLLLASETEQPLYRRVAKSRSDRAFRTTLMVTAPRVQIQLETIIAFVS